MTLYFYVVLGAVGLALAVYATTNKQHMGALAFASVFAGAATYCIFVQAHFIDLLFLLASAAAGLLWSAACYWRLKQRQKGVRGLK